jgi:integrase
MTPKKWKPVVRRLEKSWLVDCGNVFGERIRRQFKNEEKLKAFEKKMILAYQAQQDSAKIEEKNQSVLRLTKLPESDRNNLMAAAMTIAKAGGTTQSLIDAAEYYAAHVLSVKLNRTVKDVAQDYIDAKRKAERSPRTIMSSQFRLSSFKKKFGLRFIHEISTNDCELWLDAGKWTGTTRNDQRRELSGLFEFAVGRGFCKLNPVSPIEKVIVRKGKPAVFTVEQIRKLLHTAAVFIPDEYIIESRKPLSGSLKPVKDAKKIANAREQLVPYIALGLFAGLRPESELQKLDWSDIKFEADCQYIRAKGKTGERDVTMSANLIEWLAPYRRVSGKIGYSKKRLAAVVAAAGLTWSPDVMRHSFGSYHLAHHRNITETAHQMGNSTKMVKDHYENVRTAKEATEYFATVPDNKIIGLFKTPAFARAAG